MLLLSQKFIMKEKRFLFFYFFFLLIVNCNTNNNSNTATVAAGAYLLSNIPKNKKPTKPTGLVSTVNKANINFTWSASKDEDGSITDYEVSNDSGLNWFSAGTDLIHDFKDVKVGITHQLRVRAKDDKGAYSDASDLARYVPWVKKVSLKGSHSFIETIDNKLYVFGENSSGQLGLGDTVDKIFPVELTNPTETITTAKPLERGKIKEFSLGSSHSFVEMTDGKLYVFGENGSGQLGLGDTLDKNVPTELTVATATAARPLERSKIKKVTLGGTHSFIETTDNRLYVFGENGSGQLGLNDTTDRNVPTELTVITAKLPNRPIERGKVKKVTLGASHSFIETHDGELYVFGENGSGQLGLGDTTNRNVPTELTIATATAARPLERSNVKKVTLGAASSFVEMLDNKVFAFGENSNGQLGLGDTIDKDTPTELTTVANLKEIKAGVTHSFMQTTDNRLFAFGSNSSGQLGLGGSTSGTNISTARELDALSVVKKVKNVFLGFNYSFLETTKGELYVFGENGAGQLGLGNRDDKYTLVRFVVSGLE